MNEDRKIKDVYDISFNLRDVSDENKCPMNDWYNDLINKTYNQLNLFDVTRMLIQKIFVEMAIRKAIVFIKVNPFCGQRYEGELIELLYKLDISYLSAHKDTMKDLLPKALVENQDYEWLCEEERTEYKEVIEAFQRKLQCNS